ncbi:MAG: 50S ribosomal protein L9 [Opitutae bacterium]|nr:50S ribosomal protein L9 [Opitutae bacterium]
MALSEVLLKKPVAGLGAEGDQVKVRAGYARNFLLPQGIAVPLTLANRKQIEALKKARAIREARELDEAKSAAAKLEGVSLSFTVKVGASGKMFGSVSATEIAAKLVEQGFEISKKQVHLENGSIKHIGKSVAQIKFHADVVKEIEIEVAAEAIAEEPEAETAKAKKGARKPRAAKADEAAAPAAEAPAPAAEAK